MCDVEVENEEDREWVNRWFSPFDPREEEEETGNGNEGGGAEEGGADSEPEEARRVKTAKYQPSPPRRRWMSIW